MMMEPDSSSGSETFCLRIVGLDKHIEVSDLKEFFCQHFGPCVVTDIETIVNAAVADFSLAVTFAFQTQKAAAKVLVKYDNSELFGKIVSVEFTKPGEYAAPTSISVADSRPRASRDRTGRPEAAQRAVSPSGISSSPKETYATRPYPTSSVRDTDTRSHHMGDRLDVDRYNRQNILRTLKSNVSGSDSEDGDDDRCRYPEPQQYKQYDPHSHMHGRASQGRASDTRSHYPSSDKYDSGRYEQQHQHYKPHSSSSVASRPVSVEPAPNRAGNMGKGMLGYYAQRTQLPMGSPFHIIQQQQQLHQPSASMPVAQPVDHSLAFPPGYTPNTGVIPNIATPNWQEQTNTYQAQSVAPAPAASVQGQYNYSGPVVVTPMQQQHYTAIGACAENSAALSKTDDGRWSERSNVSEGGQTSRGGSITHGSSRRDADRRGSRERVRYRSRSKSTDRKRGSSDRERRSSQHRQQHDHHTTRASGSSSERRSHTTRQSSKSPSRYSTSNSNSKESSSHKSVLSFPRSRRLRRKRPPQLHSDDTKETIYTTPPKSFKQWGETFSSEESIATLDDGNKSKYVKMNHPLRLCRLTKWSDCRRFGFHIVTKEVSVAVFEHRITQVTSRTPAAHVDIRLNDYLIKITSKSTQQLNNDEIMNIINKSGKVELLLGNKEAMDNYYEHTNITNKELTMIEHEGLSANPKPLPADAPCPCAYNVCWKGPIFGFTVGPHSSKKQYHVITQISKGSSAEKVGLNIGDSLLEVDGKPVIGMSTTDIMSIICKAKEKIQLVAANDKTIEYYENNLSITISGDRKVERPMKGGNAIIVNATSTGTSKPQSQIRGITMVQASDSPRSKQNDDRKRDVPIAYKAPRTCYVKKSAGEGFGIELSLGDEDSKLFIKDITSNTPASTSGLKQYDKVLEVNGISVEKLSLNEVLSLIRQKSDDVKLKVIDRTSYPAYIQYSKNRSRSREKNGRSRDMSVVKRKSTDKVESSDADRVRSDKRRNSTCRRSNDQSDRAGNIKKDNMETLRNNGTKEKANIVKSRYAHSHNTSKIKGIDAGKRYAPPISQTKVAVKATKNDPHQTFEEAAYMKFHHLKCKSSEGFGFELEVICNEDNESKLFVKAIEPYLPAWRSGLKPLDIVCEVNNKSVENLSLDQVTDVIMEKANEVSLLVLDTNSYGNYVENLEREEAAKQTDRKKKSVRQAKKRRLNRARAKINNQQPRLCSIRKMHDEESFGFVLALGPSDSKLFIKSVTMNSPASKCNVRSYDMVLEVNGNSVQNLSLEQIMKVVEENPSKVDLLLIDRKCYRRYVEEMIEIKGIQKLLSALVSTCEMEINSNDAALCHLISSNVMEDIVCSLEDCGMPNKDKPITGKEQRAVSEMSSAFEVIDSDDDDLPENSGSNIFKNTSANKIDGTTCANSQQFNIIDEVVASNEYNSLKRMEGNSNKSKPACKSSTGKEQKAVSKVSSAFEVIDSDDDDLLKNSESNFLKNASANKIDDKKRANIIDELQACKCRQLYLKMDELSRGNTNTSQELIRIGYHQADVFLHFMIDYGYNISTALEASNLRHIRQLMDISQLQSLISDLKELHPEGKREFPDLCFVDCERYLIVEGDKELIRPEDVHAMQKFIEKHMRVMFVTRKELIDLGGRCGSMWLAVKSVLSGRMCVGVSSIVHSVPASTLANNVLSLIKAHSIIGEVEPVSDDESEDGTSATDLDPKDDIAAGVDIKTSQLIYSIKDELFNLGVTTIKQDRARACSDHGKEVEVNCTDCNILLPHIWDAKTKYMDLQLDSTKFYQVSLHYVLHKYVTIDLVAKLFDVSTRRVYRSAIEEIYDHGKQHGSYLMCNLDLCFFHMLDTRITSYIPIAHGEIDSSATEKLDKCQKNKLAVVLYSKLEEASSDDPLTVEAMMVMDKHFNVCSGLFSLMYGSSKMALNNKILSTIKLNTQLLNSMKLDTLNPFVVTEDHSVYDIDNTASLLSMHIDENQEKVESQEECECVQMYSKWKEFSLQGSINLCMHLVVDKRWSIASAAKTCELAIGPNLYRSLTTLISIYQMYGLHNVEDVYFTKADRFIIIECNPDNMRSKDKNVIINQYRPYGRVLFISKETIRAINESWLPQGHNITGQLNYSDNLWLAVKCVLTGRCCSGLSAIMHSVNAEDVVKHVSHLAGISSESVNNLKCRTSAEVTKFMLLIKFAKNLLTSDNKFWMLSHLFGASSKSRALQDLRYRHEQENCLLQPLNKARNDHDVESLGAHLVLHHNMCMDVVQDVLGVPYSKLQKIVSEHRNQWDFFNERYIEFSFRYLDVKNLIIFNEGQFKNYRQHVGSRKHKNKKLIIYNSKYSSCESKREVNALLTVFGKKKKGMEKMCSGRAAMYNNVPWFMVNYMIACTIDNTISWLKNADMEDAIPFTHEDVTNSPQQQIPGTLECDIVLKLGVGYIAELQWSISDLPTRYRECGGEAVVNILGGAEAVSQQCVKVKDVRTGMVITPALAQCDSYQFLLQLVAERRQQVVILAATPPHKLYSVPACATLLSDYHNVYAVRQRQGMDVTTVFWSLPWDWQYQKDTSVIKYNVQGQQDDEDGVGAVGGGEVKVKVNVGSVLTEYSIRHNAVTGSNLSNITIKRVSSTGTKYTAVNVPLIDAARDKDALAQYSAERRRLEEEDVHVVLNRNCIIDSEV